VNAMPKNVRYLRQLRSGSNALHRIFFDN